VQGLIGGTSLWARKTANYSPVSTEKIIADTSGGTFTITLPGSPTTGSYVTITDGADFSAINLTVARNGSTIEGIADDVLLDIRGTTFEFIYDGTTWEVVASLGEQGVQGIQGIFGAQGVSGVAANSYLMVAMSDETTSLTTGTGIVTFRAPETMYIISAKASVNSNSTSGNVTVDVCHQNSASIFSNIFTGKLKIDPNYPTSNGASFASDGLRTFAEDELVRMDIVNAGTGAKALKVILYYNDGGGVLL
jgi:hypothetical protein